MRTPGPGDHPLSDVVIHNLPVYSARADALIREIARLSDDAEQEHLEELLAVEYHPATRPDVPRLERDLAAVRDRLQREVRERGRQITD